MKKIILSFLLAVTINPAFTQKNNWMYLVNNKQFGVITPTMNYDDLVRLFCQENLMDETQSGPEGEGLLPCTVAFKETNLEMLIYWAENGLHKKISRISCVQPESPYHTKDGLKMGSTLKDLVRANNAVISFGGFGWDYGGEITSYNKGRLLASKVNFTLEWDGREDTILLGEQALKSNMPKVVKRAEKIYIAKMELFFE